MAPPPSGPPPPNGPTPASPTENAANTSHTLVLVLVSFMAIALYNAVELFFWIFDFFKRWGGCYFWSLILSAVGIIMFALGQILFFFNEAPPAAWVPLAMFGSLIMSTALVMVLYSRLHLVTSDRIARWMLWMIIVTTAIFPAPMIITFFVGIFQRKARALVISLMWERLVIAVYCAREYLILGIYVWECFRTLKSVIAVKGREGRKVRNILVATTFIIVLLDAGLLFTEFQHRRAIKFTYTTFAISVKLKMEFAILNKLVNLVQSRPSGSDSFPSDPPSSDQNTIHPNPHPDPHPPSHSQSRFRSLVHACNPFRRRTSHAEDHLCADESGLDGTSTATRPSTGLTRQVTLDEYHACMTQQVCKNHNHPCAPESEKPTSIRPQTRALSWDELTHDPSTEGSSGSGSGSKGVVITEEKRL